MSLSRFFVATGARCGRVASNGVVSRRILNSQVATRNWQSSSSSAASSSASKFVRPLSQPSSIAARCFSSSSPGSIGLMPSKNSDEKVIAPPMVYISGEEMTHYATNLLMKEWIEPYFELSKLEKFDLSCKSRDDTDDQALHDAVAAGKRIGAIFKEPTITPSAKQVKEMGLKKAFGSPNGAMRRGWNGMTISRDTIHIDGIELGYKNQVFFERHAVGGEYGAGYDEVGAGTLLTTYMPKDGEPVIVDKRDLTDDKNAVVVYHNPYDNVKGLAHIFFKRCFEANLTPYIVTKKTVFKWQEGFWIAMKEVFDEHYKKDFVEAGLMERCGGSLQHLISDAATMQLIRWTDGGFGMAAHNYDGDMLTDQIAQVHRSPGFITSNLVGINDEDGSLIKEFEASHGTVTDLWNDHLAGKETSLNPLGLAEALMGALEHAAVLDVEKNPGDDSKVKAKAQISNFVKTLRTAIHNTFRYGQGTRDMSGPSGYTTEAFIAKVAWRLERYLDAQHEAGTTQQDKPPKLREPERGYMSKKEIGGSVDDEAVSKMFNKYDSNGDGQIDFEEFRKMVVKLGIAPKNVDDVAEQYEKKSSDV